MAEACIGKKKRQIGWRLAFKMGGMVLAPRRLNNQKKRDSVY